MFILLSLLIHHPKQCWSQYLCIEFKELYSQLNNTPDYDDKTVADIKAIIHILAYSDYCTQYD